MKLDSARGLKASVRARYLAPVVERTDLVRSLGLPAQALSAVRPVQRTAALGVSVGPHGDYRLAVRLQQPAMRDLLDLEGIRREANGEVDIQYIGRVTKRQTEWQARRRPLVIGCSIGHHAITAGTLGAFVRLTDGPGEGRILSNNHVLANENVASAGDEILQAGPADGGTSPADVVGALDSFVPLDFNGNPNAVDAAVCTVSEGSDYDATTLADFGALTGLGDTTTTGLVQKVGRTTGATEGTITSFELDGIAVEYDEGVAVFDDVVEIASQWGPFSDGGDSGSLIVSSPDRRAVALLFAGSATGGLFGTGVTYACPIRTVLSATGTELVT